MKVSYKKLWYLCVEHDIGKAELRKRTGLSSATFTKLRRNQDVYKRQEKEPEAYSPLTLICAECLADGIKKALHPSKAQG